MVKIHVAAVARSGSNCAAFHPLEVPQLIEVNFDQILATAAAITDPFEQAIFVMVQLPYLQPFDDVNKRVSRLAANIPLIKGNLSPLSFADVPRQTYTEAVVGVYEQTFSRTSSSGPTSGQPPATPLFANPLANLTRSGFAIANSSANSSPS
jgi:Fic family protein